MIPIRHRKCGGQTAWYLLDFGTKDQICDPEHVVFMDGTHPIPYTEISFRCSACGEFINSPSEMRRCFDEAPTENTWESVEQSYA